MKKLVLACAMLLLPFSAAFAGDAKVNWLHPDQYRDVRAAEEIQSAFEARVFKSLDQCFEKLAKSLPEGYVWEVNVTDLDLAGEVYPSRNGMMMVRVVRDIDYPRITFDYTIKDAQGQQVAAGKENLADMSFRMHIKPANLSTNFFYEEYMISDWFHKKQREHTFPGTPGNF